MPGGVIPAARAVDEIPTGSRIVVSPACGTPTSLLGALAHGSAGRNWTLLSGLVLDPSVVLAAVGRGDLGWRTWHPTPPCHEYLAAGLMDYIPLRAFRVAKLLAGLGPEVALVRATPPDRHGWCSLGPSGSYVMAALDTARLKIAEIDPAMPRTGGQSMVHTSRLDLLCESTSPMPVYEGPTADETSRAIAAHLIDLLPERPVLQVGIGRIPEAFVHELAERGVGDLRFAGMGCDGMVELAEKDLLDLDPQDQPTISSPDLLGTSRLMEFADDNPCVGVFPSTVAHSAIRLSSLERLVSVNSAVEVDLAGQVNAEMVKGRQISGIGGSLDFAEAASYSVGGIRVVAVPSSRIVTRLGEGSVVTAPASAVDIVVTERGVARLEGMSERERADALGAIAAS